MFTYGEHDNALPYLSALADGGVELAEVLALSGGVTSRSNARPILPRRS